MRIGIITIVKVNNYGAELQAFALQKKLEMLGFESEIIDYLHYKHPCHIPTKRSKPIVNIGIVNKIKEASLLLKPKFSKRTKSLRMSRFEQFHSDHTIFSPRSYRTIDDLYAEPPDYDVYIVGSDQVWNPRTNTSLEPYFLTFAPEGKNTVSYASSFGVSKIPESAKMVYKDCLNRIRCLSVREKQGTNIIKHLTDRTAEHVLDPTLLLDAENWKQIATAPNINKPYVLLYDLIHSPYAVKLALRIAEISGCAVVRIGGNTPGCIAITDAGPCEFLGLFQHADYVVTNSFHGTAFSVNFRKPFYAVIPKGKGNSSRLSNFLESVELTDRILLEDSPYPENILAMPDFDNAMAMLADSRSKSVDFLLRSINPS